MEQTGKFRRKLNLIDLTFIGLGSIIGSGWLYSSLFAAKIAGPAAWISWVIGALVTAVLGLVFAELGSAIPRTGGLVRYAEYSHGPLMSYLISFMAFIAYSCVAGLEAQAIRGYVSSWWPALGGQNPTLLGWFFQAALLLVFFLLNYWSVNIFGKSNTIITFIKFFVPVLTVVVLLTQFHPENFSMHGFAPSGIAGIQTAITAAGIGFAYQGFQQAVFFASEAKNPGRNVPLSILLSIILATVLYVLLQICFIGALPASVLAGGWEGLNFSSPFAELTALLGFGWLMQLIMADAVLSPGGTGNIYLSATARLIFGWSKTGTFFKTFTGVDRNTGVPKEAIWLSFITAILWTLPFPSWDKLVGVASSAGLVSFLIGPISVAAFRRTAPSLERPFRLPVISIIAPAAFVISSLIVYWAGWNIVSWLLASVIVMFVLYCIFAGHMNLSGVPLAEQMKSSWWLVFYSIAMIIISYLGSFNGKSIIPAPWDQLIVTLVSLLAYYWGVSSSLSNPAFKDEEPEAVDEAGKGYNQDDDVAL
jgi:amino acid transporter